MLFTFVNTCVYHYKLSVIHSFYSIRLIFRKFDVPLHPHWFRDYLDEEGIR